MLEVLVDQIGFTSLYVSDEVETLVFAENHERCSQAIGEGNVWRDDGAAGQFRRRESAVGIDNMVIPQIGGKGLHIVAGGGDSLIADRNTHKFLFLLRAWVADTDAPWLALFFEAGDHQITACFNIDIVKTEAPEGGNAPVDNIALADTV